MFKLILIAACVATCIASSIPFDLCEDHLGSGYLPGFSNLEVPECIATPCNLQLGQNVTIILTISVGAPVTILPVYVVVTTDDMGFGMDPFDVCAAMATGCPQVAGTYKITLPITIQDEALVAGKATTVRARIDDQDNVTVACGSITTTFL